MTNYEKLNQYINFKNKEEMNEHISLHKQAHCYVLNETDKDILLRISRYSCRYYGVFYQKVSTIAKALNKSDSTVKRSIRKLEQLGIIKRYRNLRSVLGGFGANIVQIQRYHTQIDLSEMTYRQNNGIPSESKRKQVFLKSKPIYSQFKNINNINTYKNVLINNEIEKHLKISFDEMTLYQKIKYLVNATFGAENRLY